MQILLGGDEATCWGEIIHKEPLKANTLRKLYMKSYSDHNTIYSEPNDIFLVYMHQNIFPDSSVELYAELLAIIYL